MILRPGKYAIEKASVRRRALLQRPLQFGVTFGTRPHLKFVFPQDKQPPKRYNRPMTLKNLQLYCETLPGAAADFPFDENALVYKVQGKMFALTAFHDFSYISLKCDPDYGSALREAYPAVTGGYHLNKRHWISVQMDGSLSDEFVFRLILDSYYLVRAGLPQRLQPALRTHGLPELDPAAARRFIEQECEPLYPALFAFHFGRSEPEAVLEALSEYQNPDGGFGHGLEPDFLLPDSSPMATSIAFQIFDETGAGQLAPPAVEAAVAYLETSFDPSRGGWHAVDRSVNHHPHAPWWHWDAAEGQTVIDRHWGNPSAELIAHLWRHRAALHKLSPTELRELIQSAAGRLASLQDFSSPHEIYCYLRLYHTILTDLPDTAARMQPQLAAAIRRLMNTDPEQWRGYVPRPLDFVDTPDSPLFESVQPYAGVQCRYLIDTVEGGIWQPHWSWGTAYPEAWEQSRSNWTARLTINNYLLLQRFGFLPPG